MKLLVTGAHGFLGSRFAALLAAAGHEVTGVARAARPSDAEPPIRMRYGDAGGDDVAEFVSGHDAVLHFAGVPDPLRARRDPARAVRENVGTTMRLLETCAADGVTLVYPSTIRAAAEPPPDAYALSKRLGEEACRLHHAPALVLRLTSVFGPGQLAAAGATGAIANFAARALADEPIVIPGDPRRSRDFVYVDDVVRAVVRLLEDGRANETVTVASGVATPLLHAAELVREAAGSSAPIETPGGEVAPGDDLSYPASPDAARLAFDVRPLEEAVPLYVDWLRRHSASQGRSPA